MTATEQERTARGSRRGTPAYERWIESLGIPIYRGYFIEDLRALELGPWEERECNAAILVLAGQEGVQEARVTEIPPGATLPPTKIGLEEMVYVLDGRGITSVWAGDKPKKSFEWSKRSMFFIPPNYSYQIANAQGHQTARLLHVNTLPLAMDLAPNPDFFFKSDVVDLSLLYAEDADSTFSQAKVTTSADLVRPQVGSLWLGNFFPDMLAWDQLVPHRSRGAGGSVVDFRSTWGRGGHMSVFPARTYKLGHRHGPGFVIVIPGGEGFSVLWQEGGEKVFCPWHEGSIFVPPNQWFHQHFNVGREPGRYVAFSPPRALMGTESQGRRTIPYTEEDPWIRQTFEAELAKRGLTSLMPEEAYRDPNYTWTYEGD